MDSAPLLQNADGLPSPNVMQDHVSHLHDALVHRFADLMNR